jgi:hypothetical protein
VHKVLGILRGWTRGDGLTDDQVDAIDAYYTSLKDCDYLGRSLKGQCHESVSPKAPEYSMRAVSNFYENSQR